MARTTKRKPVDAGSAESAEGGEVKGGRRARFAELYALHGNASDAAREAGYAAGSAAAEGFRLLKDPWVQAKVKLIADKVTKSTIADREERLEFLTSVVRGFEDCGIRERIAAANLMSKMCGEQLVHTRISGPGGGPLQTQLSGLSLDELTALLDKTNDA